MIFLSHSSADKPLVEEVAFELTNEGIDVWLDKWELENGDSFMSEIEEGITGSSYIVIFLSPDALRSDWVQKEMKTTLGREEKENKKMLLLAKLKDCELPQDIQGRLYIDFSKSFSYGLNQLTRFLKGKAEHVGTSPHPLIPIRINGFIHVDSKSLRRLFDNIIDIVKSNKISKEQILIVHDKEYHAFKEMAYTVFDTLKTNKENLHLISEFRELLRTVEDFEELLVKGIVEILNQCHSFDYFNLVTSVSWFTKSIMHTIGAKLDRLLGNQVQLFANTELLNSPFGSNISIEKFYGIDSSNKFTIWTEAREQDYIKFTVSSNSYTARDFKEFPVTKNFMEVYDPIDWFAYLIPQMVRGGLLNPRVPIWWNFNDADIGPG